MAYRQCSRCNAVTDENESKCPFCANNYLVGGKVITVEELIAKIRKREISLSKVWTKHPFEIYQAL